MWEISVPNSVLCLSSEQFFSPLYQDPDSRTWHHYVYQPKYLDQQKSEELDREKKLKEDSPRKTPNKESSLPNLPVSLASIKEEPKEVKRSDSQSVDESKIKNDDQKTPVNWKDSRGARVAVSSPMSQHQSYIQYLHAYPYPQMYDPNHPAYRAVSPVLMHSYPGMYSEIGLACQLRFASSRSVKPAF